MATVLYLEPRQAAASAAVRASTGRTASAFARSTRGADDGVERPGARHPRRGRRSRARPAASPWRPRRTRPGGARPGRPPTRTTGPARDPGSPGSAHRRCARATAPRAGSRRSRPGRRRDRRRSRCSAASSTRTRHPCRSSQRRLTASAGQIPAQVPHCVHNPAASTLPTCCFAPSMPVMRTAYQRDVRAGSRLADW